MGSEDNLMIASGLIQAFTAVLILYISPMVGITFDQVKDYFMLIMGATGGLTTVKHIIDKRNGGGVEKRVEDMEYGMGRIWETLKTLSKWSMEIDRTLKIPNVEDLKPYKTNIGRP